jgi:predicted DCC family thiol-disulfide oxidoreductase YuxK
MSGQGPIMVFDGACNLCSASVRFILAHEAEPEIRFAAVQSVVGACFLADFGLDAMPASFVLIDDAGLLARSAAAFAVARRLRWPWRGLLALSILPRGLTDLAYDLLAANRYRLFGRHDVCLCPRPELAARFL